MRSLWRVACCLCMLATSQGALVTIQSQTQEHMDALTLAVNSAAEAHNSHPRVTLGTIEATMSRVVDIDSDYLVTVPTSVPTLQLLSDISFNSTSQNWNLRYQVMGRDTASDINQYHRVLYMTRQGNAHSGDHENACLSTTIADADCLQTLASKYIVPHSNLQVAQDALIFTGGTISSHLSTNEFSLVETLDIQIPHTVVKSLLAREEVHSSVVFGQQVQYNFGVGVLFLLPGKNTIIFDTFNLIENAQAQVVVSKSTSYSIAKHVSFFTEIVASNRAIRLVSIEYLLEAGHELTAISSSVNGVGVESADCAAMQSLVDAISGPTCLKDRQICTIRSYESQDAVSGYTWVTYTMPIPAGISEDAPKLLVNTLLTTRDKNTATVLLSTVNFETVNNPRPVCTQTTETAFNPLQFATAELYESVALRKQLLESSTHSITNHTVDGVASLTMADALMTLVLTPADSAEALEFFQINTDEVLQLDEVYMSHAKTYVEFGDIHNTLHGVTNADNLHTGRSNIVLDTGLTGVCPLETSAGFSYDAGAFGCVTTKDYDITSGAIFRPKSGVNTHFVYELTDTAADTAWLITNIFGSSATGVEAANSFMVSVQALTSGDRKPFARVYWMWPLYAWPSEAPVGLKDKTVVSLAWSMSRTSRRRRNLLQAKPTRKPAQTVAPPVERKANTKARIDMYRRYIDVNKLLPPKQSLRVFRRGVRRTPTIQDRLV